MATAMFVLAIVTILFLFLALLTRKEEDLAAFCIVVACVTSFALCICAIVNLGL